MIKYFYLCVLSIIGSIKLFGFLSFKIKDDNKTNPKAKLNIVININKKLVHCRR